MIFEGIAAGDMTTSIDVVVVALPVDTLFGSKRRKTVHLNVGTMRVIYISHRFNSRTGKVGTVLSNVGPQPTAEQAFAVSVYFAVG